MSENTNKTEAAVVTEVKKENKIVAFWKKHHEAIITGLACTAIAGTVGYVVCAAVHHEPSPKIEALDDSLELLCDPNVSEALAEAVPTPEIDAIQNPEV